MLSFKLARGIVYAKGAPKYMVLILNTNVSMIFGNTAVVCESQVKNLGVIYYLFSTRCCKCVNM